MHDSAYAPVYVDLYADSHQAVVLLLLAGDLTEVVLGWDCAHQTMGRSHIHPWIKAKRLFGGIDDELPAEIEQHRVRRQQL